MKGNGFNVSVLPVDRNSHQSGFMPVVLPEEDELRICLRVSAWLWLMGCLTSELALMRGLYTFKGKDSTFSIGSLHEMLCCRVILCTVVIRASLVLDSGFKGCLLSL